MEIKETTGVLKYNIETRNEMLRKNLGKYSQIDAVLSPAIGEAYQKRNLALRNQTDGKSILDYTHDEESSYSQNISHHYFGNTSEIDVYDVLTPTNDKLQKWGGKYENYLQHVSQVYGKELTTVNFVERLLSNQDVLYGLRTMEIGVVKDINVPLALAGAVTTNINNFSGTDTELGLITNQMYAASLYEASQFNTSRKRYDADSEYPYITPSLYNFYGNNSANVNRLGDMMRPDRITGRIKDDNGLNIDLKPKDRTYWDDDVKDGYGTYDERTTNSENTSVKYLKRQVNETIKNRINDIASYQNRRNIYTPREAYMSKSGTTYLEYPEYNEYGEKTFDVTSNDPVCNFKNDTIRDSDKTKSYDEGDSQWGGNGTFLINQEDNEFKTFEKYSEQGKNTLLDKTNTLFRRHKLETLVGRFHTSSEYNGKYDGESFDTAKTKAFGKSKGRNLLKLNETTTNGYSNPYCRVWTYHHQYDRLTKRIRPFTTDNGDAYSLNDLQKLNENFRAKGLNSSDGWDYLAEKTVLNKTNSLVNIVPSESGNVEIAKCMFSIENLAWKDVPHMDKYLSEEQRGPLGGRIMWFPPYDLKFNESVNVDWNSNSFIGRGEKVYTYTNTDRTATLDFTILIDHPAIINEVRSMTAKTGSTDSAEEAIGLGQDILRFFAGCGPLDNGKTNNVSEEEEKQTTKADSNEPEETLNQEKTKKLKFYVFFPNNYSGNYNDGEEYSKAEWQKDGRADGDWAQYLLMGQNIGVPKNGGEYCGYEMGKSAISNVGEGTDNEYITTAEQTKNWEVFPEYSGNDKEKRKYYYRVDFDLRQKLFSYDNYFDKNCFGLNIDAAEVNKFYPDADCSFMEFMLALFYHRVKENYEKPSDYYHYAGENYQYLYDKLLSLYGDDNIVNVIIVTIDEILSSGEVKQINPVGGATIQDKKNSSILAYRRSRCLGTYVKNMLNFDGEIDYSNLDDVEDLPNDKTVNSEAAKAQRYASVEIVFGSPENKDSNEVLDKANNVVTEVKTGNTDNTTADNTGGTQIVTIITTTGKTRYETEAEYFDKLQMRDSFFFKELTSKYKYFNPAFHSLSPEGFNARLTFLHQCTRQGHTVSTADQNFAKTAGNLSFGRSPVCVLRIGDFFNSKVLITSMNISYENGNGMQWDLNPEGAGVQPMYAHVSLSLVILGGQTLDGPADRLQNAQTFNYYANTGVYDNRADRITIDSNGNLTYNDIFVPYEVDKNVSKSN